MAFEMYDESNSAWPERFLIGIVIQKCGWKI